MEKPRREQQFLLILDQSAVKKLLGKENLRPAAASVPGVHVQKKLGHIMGQSGWNS